MAARCPTRKTYVKTKTAEIRSAAKNGRRSYASAASTSAPSMTTANAPGITAANNHNLNQKQSAAISVAINFAIRHEAVRPGVFQNTLSKILKKNGVPDVIIPLDVLGDIGLMNANIISGADVDVSVKNVNGVNVEASTSRNVNVNESNVNESNVSMETEVIGVKRVREDDNESNSSSSGPSAKHKAPRVVEVNENEIEVNDNESEANLAAEVVSNPGATPKATSASVTRQPKSHKPPKKLGMSLFYSVNAKNLPRQMNHEQLVDQIYSKKQVKFQFTGNYTNDHIKTLILTKEFDLARFEMQPVDRDRFISITNGFVKLGNKIQSRN